MTLLACHTRYLDPSTAHQEQISIFHKFDSYSSCATIWGEIDRNRRSKLVDSFPAPQNTENALKCIRKRKAKHLYHPICLSRVMGCWSWICTVQHVMVYPSTNWSPWLIMILSVTKQKGKVIPPGHHLLTTLAVTQWYLWNHHSKSAGIDTRMCVVFVNIGSNLNIINHAPRTIMKIKVSLTPTPSVITVTNDLLTLKNAERVFEFVLKETLMNQRHHFFYFTGPKTSPVLNSEYQYSTSLVAKCQPGFEIHDNTAQACYPPKENRHHTDYHVANLFQTTLIVHFQHNVLVNSKLSATQNAIMQKGIACNNLPDFYDKILPTDLLQPDQCVILYFDPMAFANFSQDLGVYKVAKDVFPEANLLRTMLLNHDPISNISCSGDIKLKSMTPHQDVIDGVVHVRSVEFKQLFASNKDPMVILVLEGGSGIDILAFECQPHIGDKTSSERLQKESLSSIDSCLKYEVAYYSNPHNDTIVLKPAGHWKKMNSYLLTGAILMCVDLYEESHKKRNMWLILESAAYTVSLLCLLITFMIYCRYRALRTLPGLMLMNITTALFFAQLLFLLNRWRLFQALPTLCQIVASAQHYFWLASFAWMACMSMDVFHCLANGCRTVNVYTKSKYIKYVFAGWLLPVPVPAITNVLTKVTVSTLAYDTCVSCWLATHQGILYLFAIPVLTIFFGNILLFIGSVCRLSILLKNASFVGRKMDNQQRLAQCFKLSSWMGVSHGFLA